MRKVTVPGDPASDSDRLTMCNRERGTLRGKEKNTRDNNKRRSCQSWKIKHTNQKKNRQKRNLHDCDSRCSLIAPLGVSQIPRAISVKDGGVVYE